MMRHLLFILLSILLLGSCASDDKPITEGPDVTNDSIVKELFSERYNINLSFYSSVLKETLYYSVLLPDGYSTQKDVNYGVVYLLHGWGGDQSSWGPNGLNIKPLVDLKESAGSVRPLIYVMPQGFNSYYCNKYDGGFDYMKMFVKELVPKIDKRFRTTAKASERAVVGFSMGGFGALTLASQNPAVFSVSVGLSPSLNTDEQYKALSTDGWNLQWGSVFGGYGSSGTSRITDYYKSQCPLHFFAEKPFTNYSGIYYYIDCGDDEERLSVGNGALHNIMRNNGLKHEYRVRSGAHTESYWRGSILEVLPFIEKCFQKTDYDKETIIPFTIGNHSVRKQLDIKGLNADIFLPDNYNSSISYKVLYYAKGEGKASPASSDVETALDSLLNVRQLIIVGFDAQDALKKDVKFNEIAGAVDTQFSTINASQGRLGLYYGKGADYLYTQTCGESPLIDYFYVTDASFNNKGIKPSGKYYYIDITDDGTNYSDMQQFYEDCKNAGVEHEYRVRNGVDNLQSFKSGVYSMSYFIGQFLTRK